MTEFDEIVEKIESKSPKFQQWKRDFKTGKIKFDFSSVLSIDEVAEIVRKAAEKTE